MVNRRVTCPNLLSAAGRVALSLPLEHAHDRRLTTATMNLRILFWNVCGRGRRGGGALALVPSLVREFEPSVLTLLEAPGDTEARLRGSGLPMHLANLGIGDDNHRGLLTFGLDERLRLTERVADRHHRAYEVSRAGYEPLNLVAVHLRSPLHDTGDSTRARERRRADRCRAFVENVEDVARHARTIVYGDFNMDPFSGGMVDIDGLNAVSTAFRARRRRSSEGITRATLYNPMWSKLGDRPSPGRQSVRGRRRPGGVFLAHARPGADPRPVDRSLGRDPRHRSSWFDEVGQLQCGDSSPHDLRSPSAARRAERVRLDEVPP
jgi:hypothetical protein